MRTVPARASAHRPRVRTGTAWLLPSRVVQVAVVDRTGVFRLLEVEMPATVAAQDAVALELYERGADYCLIGRLIGSTRTVAHRRVRRALQAIRVDHHHTIQDRRGLAALAEAAARLEEPR